jgi:antirestriction protein ArdC
MTRAEKGAYKAAKREEAREMMAAAVDQLRDSEGWSRWVRTRARFRTYSLGNQMLISMQRPDATRVAGFKTWQGLGRQVRKGEKAISILAPRTFKGIDEETGEPVKRLYFRAVPVFDIAQTDGEELPPCPLNYGEVDGDSHADYIPRLIRFAESIGWTVEYGDTGSAGGWAMPSAKRIRLSDADVSPNATVRTLVHELCHALGILYDGLGREYAEMLTETAAFAVCSSIGLDTSAASIPYVTGWSADKPDGSAIVRDMAALVDGTAKQIETFLDSAPAETESELVAA